MGWKVSMIIVNNPIHINPIEILNRLGCKGYSLYESKNVNDILPFYNNNEVYIGNYRNNLIIYNWILPENLLLDKSTDLEINLLSLFPSSEICVIELFSTVNFWGFKVFKNQKLIRHKVGDADHGTHIDIGEPLPEELELLSKSFIDDEGNRKYNLDEGENEPYSEDQVGEEFVFEIVSRYFGQRLDEEDEFFEETLLTGYKKSWWRFW